LFLSSSLALLLLLFNFRTNLSHWLCCFYFFLFNHAFSTRLQPMRLSPSPHLCLWSGGSSGSLHPFCGRPPNWLTPTVYIPHFSEPGPT
jgi:hypothetical protein